jgi:hypothetical protein
VIGPQAYGQTGGGPRRGQQGEQPNGFFQNPGSDRVDAPAAAKNAPAAPRVVFGKAVPYCIALPQEWGEGKAESPFDLSFVTEGLWFGVVADRKSMETAEAAAGFMKGLGEGASKEPQISNKRWMLIDERVWSSFQADILRDGTEVSVLYFIHGDSGGVFILAGGGDRDTFSKERSKLESLAKGFRFPKQRPS